MSLQEDIVRHFRKCLRENGHSYSGDLLVAAANAYVAKDKAEAITETGPHYLYFNRTLFSHGSFTETSKQKDSGYVSPSARDYVRPSNQQAAARSRSDFREMTEERMTQLAQDMPWGSADEVTARLINQADRLGAETMLVSLNRGVMPHDMYMTQISRFAKDVLPALQAHKVRQDASLALASG